MTPVRYPVRRSLGPLVRLFDGGNMVLRQMMMTQSQRPSAPRTAYQRYSHGPPFPPPGVLSALPDSTRGGGYTTPPSFAPAPSTSFLLSSSHSAVILSRQVYVSYPHAVPPRLGLLATVSAPLDASSWQSCFFRCITSPATVTPTGLSNPPVVPPLFPIRRRRARAHKTPLPV